MSFLIAISNDEFNCETISLFLVIEFLCLQIAADAIQLKG